MEFIQRKLVIKFATLTAGLAVVLILSLAIFKSLDINFISVNLAVISNLVIIVLCLLSLIILITRPLKLILKEIKALLTGREYRRILTNKIDEIGVIAHFFNEVTKSLERASNDIRDQRRMSAELEIASRIQADILPKKTPDIDHLTILCKNKSAAEIGGDSFDFIKSKDNVFMYIGDATGHGLPAGLVMMMVDALISTFTDMYDSAKTVVVQTNRYLKPLLTSIRYMTAIMLRWHEPTQKMYACGAGHEYIIIHKHKTNKCLIQKSGGLALGMIDNNDAFSKEILLDFEPNDTIILYTDGITEAKNSAGQRYELSGLTKVIEQSSPSATLEEVLANISASLDSFTENQIQEDDMSLILIRYSQENPSEENKNSIIWNIGGSNKSSLIKY